MNRQEHLLVILSEECDEVGQRASKALRFGLDEIKPEQSLTNAEMIIYEFNDIVAVMEMLKEEGFLPTVIDREAIDKKKNKINKYLEYSKKVGTLVDNTNGFNQPSITNTTKLLSEEKIDKLALVLANHDFDSNIGKVIMPLKVCRQIVQMIAENLH